MNDAIGVAVLAMAVIVPSSAAPQEKKAAVPTTAADLAGAWAGTLTHDGETTPFALEFEAGDEGKVLVKMSIPAIHVAHSEIGRVAMSVQEGEVKLGPFTLTHDRAAGTLSGTMPAALVPAYKVPFTLRRVERLDLPARPEPSAPLATPVWTFEAGAPLWAGATFAGGVVYAGGEDGRLHALQPRTGKEVWAFNAGGAIRTRPTVAGDDVYFQADDGILYALTARDGRERWRLKVVEKPIERLPFDNPKSRYDRFGSDVTVADGRLYLGTHDGHVMAVDPAKGAKVWDFASGDAVLAAPAVHSGRVYFGSFDRHVYALEAATGKLLWKRDTAAPVVSTPAVAGDSPIVIGSRSYDLLGLDARSGEIAWKRYVWFSWIESSATIRDGVAYVGSSDAAAVFAHDVRDGRLVWKTDVYGWAWGQPAVSNARVYVGAASTKDYLAGHRGGALALDRKTGRLLWRFEAKPAESGSFGFPGSPALGAGLVFLTGLDGRVYAFAA